MTRFIAVASGKGGVGKTTTTINLGHALSKLGKRTVLLDANLVTPNLGIHFGLLNPEGTLNKFLRKEKSLKEITYLHGSGISLIPASPSYDEFQKTNIQKLGKIFEHLDDTTDFVLVDSPSGLGYEVDQVFRNCDDVLLVVNPTLSSVMDALKTARLATDSKINIAGVLINMSNKGRHELNEEEISQIIGFPIIGNVLQDKKIRKSLHKQLPLTQAYPRSKSAREFVRVAGFLSLENLR